MKQLFTFFMSFLMGFLVLQTSGELLASERLPLKETQVQNARFLINESFVNGIPDDWTVINANNDPHTWVGFEGDGYSNNFSASIRSWAFPHDDYLVTPHITVEEDMVLSLWAKSGSNFFLEPRIKTSGYDMLELSFKNFVDNFSGPAEYTLKVLAIADDVEYLIEEWVDPETIPAYEFEAILTAADHGVGTDYFHIAWV